MGHITLDPQCASDVRRFIQALLYEALRCTYKFCELDGVPGYDGEIHYKTPVRVRLYGLVRHIDHMVYDPGKWKRHGS